MRDLECAACGYDADTTQPRRLGNGEMYNVCDVCYRSLISATLWQPRAQSDVLQTIGYCTNLILDEIRKARA